MNSAIQQQQKPLKPPPIPKRPDATTTNDADIEITNMKDGEIVHQVCLFVLCLLIQSVFSLFYTYDRKKKVEATGTIRAIITQSNNKLFFL